MKRIILLTMVFLSLHFTGISQVCGTIDDGSMMKRLKENIRASKELEPRFDEWYYIPIQFHIVRETNGDGGIAEDKILKELAHINKNYAPLKMHFYLNGPFNYINYSKLYNTPRDLYSKAWIRKNRDKFKKALNIFMVNKIGGNGSGGEVLGYYTPDLDVLVIKNDQFAVKGQTATHELGHFFSLAHTFHGWEEDPYDPVKHGNPLNILNKKIGNKTYIIEFMDKSNCHEAADLFCDTPPDYNFGITDPERDCKLNGPIMDYHGDTIITMENNYMSYFFNCGDYQFTQEQQLAIRADFKSAKRKFLRSDYVPDTASLDVSTFKVIAPANKEKMEFYDYVKLDWSDVPTATYYYVIVSPKSQSFKQEFFLTDKSEFIYTNGAKSKLYRWYVIPFKVGNTAAPKLGGNVFKTGDWTVATKDIEKEDANILVYPNPVTGKQITIKTGKEFGKSKIKIYDISGRLIENIPLFLHKGENKLNLTHSNYQNGMYNIVINTAKAKYIRKVFIKNRN